MAVYMFVLCVMILDLAQLGDGLNAAETVSLSDSGFVFDGERMNELHGRRVMRLFHATDQRGAAGIASLYAGDDKRRQGAVRTSNGAKYFGPGVYFAMDSESAVHKTKILRNGEDNYIVECDVLVGDPLVYATSDQAEIERECGTDAECAKILMKYFKEGPPSLTDKERAKVGELPRAPSWQKIVRDNGKDSLIIESINAQLAYGEHPRGDKFAALSGGEVVVYNPDQVRVISITKYDKRT